MGTLYTITRESAERDWDALRAILDNDGIVAGDVEVLQQIVKSIKGQIPKPAIEEPQQFGSVVRVTYPPSAVLHFCRTYSVDVKEPWCSGNHLRSWVDVVEGATDVEVLRVGIGDPSAAEWARLDGANADSEAYNHGRSDLAYDLRVKLDKLRSEAITSERKSAYDKAISTVDGMQP